MFGSYSTGQWLDALANLTSSKDRSCKAHVLKGRNLTVPKLLEQVRLHMRTRHYSYRTEQSYLHWPETPRDGKGGKDRVTTKEAWRCDPADRAGPQISRRRQFIALAICFPGFQT